MPPPDQHLNKVYCASPEVSTPSKGGCSCGWSQGVGGRVQLRLDEAGSEGCCPHKLGCSFFACFWLFLFFLPPTRGSWAHLGSTCLAPGERERHPGNLWSSVQPARRGQGKALLGSGLGKKRKKRERQANS